MLRLFPLLLVTAVASTVITFGPNAHAQSLESNDSKPVSDSDGRTDRTDATRPFITVLGIAQDAGYPQAGCRKDCCREAWTLLELRRRVTALSVTDPATRQTWLIDCTPDFPDQLRSIQKLTSGEPAASASSVSGIFLTHAHIGHYSGLIHLGREVMGTQQVPVWAMPRMKKFLSSNGPWSQLVKLDNIRLSPLQDGRTVRLNDRLSMTPFIVPHRDEFSETVGFRISSQQKSAIFIPDIDKWSRWDRPVEDLIRASDVAYLDGTFYANGEIPGRDMSQIPHPFIEESLSRFSKLESGERNKVRFIHLNHTNPALKGDSAARRQIESVGCHVARQDETFEL